MKFVEWNGNIVTAEDNGVVLLDARVVATATAVPGMVMIPTKNLLDLLNAKEVKAAMTAAMGIAREEAKG